MAIRRARILLGTLVEIRVDDDDGSRALAAIEGAFAEIAEVHRLMSFHANDSDLARIHREAARAPVSVDPRTHEVLALALDFARASQGRFDPTIAAQLVEWGRLPCPVGVPRPDRDADWRDIALLADHRVHFAKPLLIDLGGIAKGYAVDRAIDRLRAFGVARACVNAGGDLRRIGDGVDTIHVRSAAPPHRPIRALQLGEGAIASSATPFDAASRGVHVDGVSRGAAATGIAVSVVADRCVVADALTKIVLADVEAALPLLATWNAEALVHDARGACRLLGRAA